MTPYVFASVDICIFFWRCGRVKRCWGNCLIFARVFWWPVQPLDLVSWKEWCYNAWSIWMSAALKVIKNVDFSASAFQTSLNHFLDLWLLPAVPLSFLATAALQAGQKPSQLSTRLPCFWSIPILFIVAIHCSSPLSRQKLHQLLSTCLLKYCCTSHCFTLPNSLLQLIFIMPYYYYIYYNVWKI